MSRRISAAAAIDAAAVVLFVVAGRGSHDEGSAVGGTLTIAAPFLLAALVVWLAARVWQRPTAVAAGLVVWLGTVAGGLVLRRTIFDRGTAVSFVIVTTIMLGCFLLGWRAAARFAERRGSRRPTISAGS